jgi:maltooligosyltrehalose trehalohydrolase
LSQLVPFEALKLAAGIVLLSPFIPLIFMGEEYGETAPFPYFVSHSEPELIEAVRKGRREEFASFRWQGELPDPQDEATFLSARINHNLRNEGQHHVLLEFYRELIRLRKEVPALAHLSKDTLEIKGDEENKTIFMHRYKGGDEVIAVFNFSDSSLSISLPVLAGRWRKRLDSAEERWQGKGSTVPEQIISTREPNLNLAPKSFVLFVKET